MNPWKKQQFWFWLAAILIVGGASSFRDTRHENASVRARLGSHKAENVFRSRENLPEPNQLEVASGSPMKELQPKSTHSPLNGTSQTGTLQNEVVERVPHQDAQVVQISYEREDEVARPVVWLVGSIEPEEE
ncbi:hypothetical protein [Thalassoglobus polymorphus]|uniref:Uncharacterized protein n=1 Tax=Thalassoglobus polymorphus TaxID=2527994 RepID=A0A517QTU9_9PLAN|nr:hypothetical protein [Thalassoglobus polymorphus]QDT35032.1 hypothetical protein Mal48_43060 [Thalassoglobus polymorphus]